MRIQARFIVMDSQRILHPGQIVIADNRIVEVERGCDRRPDVDLGDAVILPGLINCHAHLELSGMREPIAATGPFPDWIGQVIRYRLSMLQGRGDAEVRSVVASDWAAGLDEAQQSGTSLVADIVSSPWDANAALRATRDVRLQSDQPRAGTQVICLAEVLGLTAERWQQTCGWAETMQTSLSQVIPQPGIVEGWGVSPHAPYSLDLQACSQFYKRIGEPPLTAMHVAESRDELEWLAHGTGSFRQNFERLGFPLDQRRPSIDEAIDFLGDRKRGLLVHGNYLNDGQIEKMAALPHLSVVYCPRTHTHFAHAPYPLVPLLQSGVRLVFGTDSRASNPDLCLWREVVAARRKHAELTPQIAFSAVTENAAIALGLSHARGTIEVGKSAWVCVADCPVEWTAANLLESLTSTDCPMSPLSVRLANDD